MRVNTSLAGLTGGGAAASIFALASANIGFYIATPEALSPDRKILLALTMALVFSAVFSAGHAALRRKGKSHRLLYSAIGALGMVAALMVFADPVSRNAMINSGAFITSLTLPAATGWLIGSLYHWHAGYEVDGDDVEALATAAQQADDSIAPANFPLTNETSVPRNPAFIATTTAEYFDGPTQVRSSINAAIMAAVAAVMTSHIALWFFMIFGHYMLYSPTRGQGNGALGSSMKTYQPGIDIPDYSVLTEVVTAVLGSGLMLSLVLVIPVALIVYVGHLGLRAFKRSTYLDYGLAGLTMPPVIGLLLFFAFFFVGLQLAIPFAMAMMLYRRLAGLEPLAVREDIEVRDRRSLVAADHARRRYARVIDRS